MDKLALVTGGGRDIGRGIVERLARTHGAVALHAHQSIAAAVELAARLEQAGVRARAFPADLGRAGEVEALFGAFDAWRATLGGAFRFTTLVNNSAVALASPLGSTDGAAIDALVDVNLKGTFRVTQESARRLVDGGRIVQVTLDSHAVFHPDYALFTASKAALDALTRHWAAGLGARGITVNSVAPGVVEVNFRAQLLQDPAFRGALEGAVALRRVGQVPDIVDVVEFFTTDAARWVTGQVIAASGGWKL